MWPFIGIISAQNADATPGTLVWWLSDPRLTFTAQDTEGCNQAGCLSCLQLLVVPAVHAHASLRIYDIQGRGAVLPLRNRHVTRVPGIVTVPTRRGFYMQDPEGDGNPATSDGIFVYTHNPSSVDSGEHVRVSGIVREYRPGGRKSGNLLVTEIHAGRVRPGCLQGKDRYGNGHRARRLAASDRPHRGAGARAERHRVLRTTNPWKACGSV